MTHTTALTPEQGFRQNLTREHGFEQVAQIEGRVPSSIHATLYRNGPALFERFGTPYEHAFMGDGAITAIHLEEGRCQFATRFVRTEAFMQEEARGQMLYGPGVSWLTRMRNQMAGRSKPAANVNVIAWQDKLLALPEGAPPQLMDANTLDTLGELPMGDLARGYHSPHPHRVESRHASFSFRLLWGKRNTLSVFCLPDEGAPYELTRIDLGEACYFHDFVATPDHLIFFVPPVRIRVLRAMLQFGGLADIFAWRPELGTRIIVVPIEQPDQIKTFHTDALFVWHFGNAFCEQDVLHVDFSHWADFSSFDAVGNAGHKTTSTPTLQRISLDLNAHTVHMNPLSSSPLSAEFPCVASHEQGHQSTCIWAQTERGDRSGILMCQPERSSSNTFMFDEGQIASEPNLIQTRTGDTSHVSTLVYDHGSRRSFLALFDAMRIADGPVAKIWLTQAIPMTFHGFWLPH